MLSELEEFRDFIKDSTKYGLWITLKSLVGINRLYFQKYYIKSVLDFAKENDLKFTFFITAKNLKKKAYLIKRMLNEGHEIGSHSYHHILHGEHDYERISKEFDMARREFKKYGIKPRGFRAPFLSINKGVIKAIKEFGMEYSSNVEGGKIFRYNNGVSEVPIIDPYDWKGFIAQRLSSEELFKKWRGQNGTFLLHPWVIVKYLPNFKREFLKKGKDYRIVSNYKKGKICVSFDVY